MKIAVIAAVCLLAGYAPGTGSSHRVARIWHGRVAPQKAEEYQKYLYDAGIKKIRGVPKNLGAQMLRRDNQADSEFIVISYWPDRESIHAFAGAEIEKVHSLAKDPEYLLEVEPSVRHFDVVVDER